jgi:hypothetical protein
MPQKEPIEGKYLYCIIRIPASESPDQFTTLGIGQRGDSVEPIQYQDLAAVVSDSPVIDYERTRRNMMAHTKVLEEVMETFTILPVRFGTVAPEPEDVVEKVLKPRYDELCDLMVEMEGRIELGLKAFWYEDVIFNEIVSENPPIRRLRDSLLDHPAEKTHFERIRLGEMIEEAMEEKRAQDAERLLKPLRTLAQKTRTNYTFSDRMVVNTAFLVEESQEEAFDQRVEQLDDEMGDRLMFKYVGPVPPYNFVDIVVRW